MIRLFVALPLPEAVRAQLAALSGGVPGARWTDPENFHITLRFIGEVDQGRLEDIDAALNLVAAPGFSVVLDGIGQFGGGKPRVLWAGAAPNEALHHLQAKVESALVRCGLPPEERKYSPHITLARLKETSAARVVRFIEERALFRSGPIRVDRFVLYASHLGRTGPTYEPLREYDLLT